MVLFLFFNPTFVLIVDLELWFKQVNTTFSKRNLNLNVKSIWNQIRVNGIADADGDVVEAGVTEFGIIAD